MKSGPSWPRRADEIRNCSSTWPAPAARTPTNSMTARGNESVGAERLLALPSLPGGHAISEGFPLFGEAFLMGEGDPGPKPRGARSGIFRSKSAYEGFLAAKTARPSPDTYAAFQPFNESTRALFPLLDVIRAALKPGDLDCGHVGSHGLFRRVVGGPVSPNQHVISLWEGDSNVLGYQGYRHWLGEGRRAANWDVFFHSRSALALRHRQRRGDGGPGLAAPLQPLALRARGPARLPARRRDCFSACT